MKTTSLARPPARTARRTARAGGKRRHETIYAAIYDAIVDRKLVAGAKLAEDVLSEVFGVSRTVIRAVLQRLGFEGLVTQHRNRGAFVAKPTIEEAKHVFEARRVIELVMVRGLAGQLNRDAKRRLATHLEREHAARAAKDQRHLIRLSGEFHLLLAEIYGNEVLTRYLRELVSRSSLIISVHSTNIGASCADHAHERLVKALGRNDPETAANLLVAHLEEVEQSLDLEQREAERPDLRSIFGV